MAFDSFFFFFDIYLGNLKKIIGTIRKDFLFYAIHHSFKKFFVRIGGCKNICKFFFKKIIDDSDKYYVNVFKCNDYIYIYEFAKSDDAKSKRMISISDRDKDNNHRYELKSNYINSFHFHTTLPILLFLVSRGITI